MKKIKILKSLLLLFAVFTLSNCEEDGEIQFIVIDEFETDVNITGLAAQSSFTESSSTNISELLDNASKFVDADIEKVTISLKDYSGTSISGNWSVSVSGMNIISQNVALSEAMPAEIDLSSATDILSIISSGSFPFTLTATSATPLGDNDFTINLKFKVKATVE